MKKLISGLVIPLTLLVFVSSCGKDDLTADNLDGTWNIGSYTEDGVSVYTDGANYGGLGSRSGQVLQSGTITINAFEDNNGTIIFSYTDLILDTLIDPMTGSVINTNEFTEEYQYSYSYQIPSSEDRIEITSSSDNIVEFFDLELDNGTLSLSHTGVLDDGCLNFCEYREYNTDPNSIRISATK